MSARSRQRGSPRSPDRELELAWAPSPRQELVEAQAEAALAHRRAETRDLEAKTAENSRKAAAEVALLETRQEKLAGEVAQQPLEAEERRARIEESEARTARIWLMVFLPPLLLAVSVVTGSLDCAHMTGNGLEIISQKFFWLMKSSRFG